MKQTYVNVSKLLSECPDCTQHVVEAGRAALDQVSPEEKAIVRRMMSKLKAAIPQMGDKGALELLTLIALEMVAKDPPQVQAGAGRVNL